MKKLLVLLLIIPSMALAQRYASNRTADEAFLANPKDTPSVIRWIVLNDVDAYCRSHSRRSDNQPAPGTIRACARFNENVCNIYTGPETSHALLGHEFRHCFEGRFHD